MVDQPVRGGFPEAVTVQIAQFEAVREEIARRSNTQWTLFTFNLTLVGAIGGFFLETDKETSILLLLPLLCPSLGLLFIDHARHIARLGRFVKEELAPQISVLSGVPNLLQYESHVQEYQQKKEPLFNFMIPMFLVFFGPAAAGLLQHPCVLNPRDAVLWVFGLILTLLFGGTWWAIPIGRTIGSPISRHGA